MSSPESGDIARQDIPVSTGFAQRDLRAWQFSTTALSRIFYALYYDQDYDGAISPEEALRCDGTLSRIWTRGRSSKRSRR